MDAYWERWLNRDIQVDIDETLKSCDDKELG